MDLSKLGLTDYPWKVATESEKDGFYILGKDINNQVVTGGRNKFNPLGVNEETDAQLIATSPEMLQDMIWFVLRCEKGEVRSKRTYAKFKATIEKACYPKKWEEIKELIK